MSLVKIKDLAVQLGGNTVLHSVDFSIDAGEIVTIVGPNGSGKSTLLRAIIGAVQPYTGTITRQPELRIGYVPQRLQIDATLPLTVGRFLSLPHAAETSDATVALEEAGAGDLVSRQMAGLSGVPFAIGKHLAMV